MDIFHSSASHREKATHQAPKPTPSSTPLECQKLATLTWDAEKQIIGRNGVQKAISQTKMTTKCNSICFLGLNDLSTIPSTLSETLQSNNYEYKSGQKTYFSK